MARQLTLEEIQAGTQGVSSQIPQLSRDIQSLQIGEGNTNAQALLGSRLAVSAGESTPSKKFGAALMDILKSMQQLPIAAPFNLEASRLRQEQAQRLATPGIPGMSPALQSSIRGAEVGALEPSISGAERGARGITEQLGKLGDVLSQARLLGQFMQTEEQNELTRQDTKRKEKLDLMLKAPAAFKTYFSTLDPKKQKTELDSMGIGMEFVNALPDEMEEPERQVVGKTLLEKDKTTGQWNVIYKEPETGTGTIPPGAIPKGGFKFETLEEIRNLPVSELTKAVIAGYGRTKDLTPTERTKVITELYQVGFNPYEYINRKLDLLATQYDNVSNKYKGIIGGRIPFTESVDPSVGEFESMKQVLTREVARLFDVGVLSDQDVAAYNRAMPSRGDANKEVVKGKIKGLKETMGGALKTNQAEDEWEYVPNQ